MIKNNEEIKNLEESEVEVKEDVNPEITELEAPKQEERQIATSEKSDATTTFKKFDLSEIQNPETKAHRAKEMNKVDFSVVNDKNGHWVKVSKEVLKKIDAKDRKLVSIVFLPYGVVVSNEVSGIGEAFPLSKGGHIYSKGLVEEITEKFKLDFTDVTTRSFADPEYQKLDNGCSVAIIKM